MRMDLVNSHAIKIMIAARPEDSILSIAKRIGLSYGWTYKWAHELIEEGIFKIQSNRIILQTNHKFYKETIDYVKRVFAQDVSFYYSALRLFGITYRFSKTDAVFVWTKGGYNISRSKYYYPVFVTVKTTDKPLFEYYCKKLGLQVMTKHGVFYSVDFVDNFEREYCQGVPVEPISITIDFMKKYIYNFQPALEMIAKMYPKKVTVAYREVAYA